MAEIKDGTVNMKERKMETRENDRANPEIVDTVMLSVHHFF